MQKIIICYITPKKYKEDDARFTIMLCYYVKQYKINQ